MPDRKTRPMPTRRSRSSRKRSPWTRSSLPLTRSCHTSTPCVRISSPQAIRSRSSARSSPPRRRSTSIRISPNRTTRRRTSSGEPHRTASWWSARSGSTSARSRLNPNLDDVHQHLGTLYLHVGLLDQAVAEFQKALELQPGDHNAVRRIGITLIYRGQYEEGLRTFRQAPPQSNASLWHYQVAWALLYLGRDQEARTLMDDYLRAHPDDRGGVVSSTRAIWFAKVGDARSAEADILAAQAKGKGFIHFHHSAYNIASAYALLGRAERAVHWLRIAAETGWPCYPYFANDPNLEKLHGDDAYEKLMQQLKAQWQTYQLTL